ncbi:MAG TPA: cell division protein FtsX [Acetobacteraceae bacterium]|nr:cell division protein FtsX [Acetobacteraceae bacterium]
MAPVSAHRLSGRRDPLGLRRALADRLLVGLVAAMALLASLALAGREGAAALASRWQQGTQAAVTVQIPEPDADRMARALSALRAQPEVASARVLEPERMQELLRPWLGETPGLALPGVIEVRLASLSADPVLIGDRVAAAVPGAVTEAHGVWVARIAALAEAVQGVALAAVLLVAAVAAAVIAVATRAGIAACEEAIRVLHGLGARDGEIARRIAARAAQLAGIGALGGALLAVPALVGIAALAAPIGGAELRGIEAVPWLDLALVPVAAWAIGWLTAEASVRSWLRRLP